MRCATDHSSEEIYWNGNWKSGEMCDLQQMFFALLRYMNGELGEFSGFLCMVGVLPGWSGVGRVNYFSSSADKGES
jgi:hypothetical protein